MTQETKHTPGPWKYGRFQKGKYRGDFGIVPTLANGENSGPTFAYLAQGRDDIQEANARLITAAPDMLSALRLAERRLVAAYGEPVEGASLQSEAGVEAIVAVRAAIAKAEGR